MPEINIDAVLPHRGRMRLIDEVIEAAADKAVTLSTVTETWPLFKHNGVSPLVLIELAAQTAGICLGWKRREIQGATEGMGWLVGIKKAEFHVETIRLGSPIVAELNRGFDFENYHEVTGKAVLNGGCIADIHLQILEADSE